MDLCIIIIVMHICTHATHSHTHTCFKVLKCWGTISPEEVVAVGNMLTRDVLGAQRMGMASLWIDRNEDKNLSSMVCFVLTLRNTNNNNNINDNYNINNAKLIILTQLIPKETSTIIIIITILIISILYFESHLRKHIHPHECTNTHTI